MLFYRNNIKKKQKRQLFKKGKKIYVFKGQKSKQKIRFRYIYCADYNSKILDERNMMILNSYICVSHKNVYLMPESQYKKMDV